MIKKLGKIGLIMLSVIMAVSAFAACGGEKFDENKAIVVVSREEGSGSRNAFMELVFGSSYAEITLPAAHVSHTSYSAVFNKVKTDPQAIAYDSFGFATDEVKILSVDGVACNDTNIANGTYKLMRPFSMMYKEENITGAKAKFLEFIISAEAQAMISDNGLTSDSSRTSTYVAETGLTGTIKVSGGSTVKLIVDQLAERFMELQPGVTVEVSGSNTSGGRNDVKNDVSDFGMAGSKVTPAHIEDMESTGGKVIVTKLCDDGIAVTVNKKNPITNITMEQLQNIYNGNATTKYSNWAELMAAQQAA